MEKLNFFLFDLFGNLIPGGIIGIIFLKNIDYIIKSLSNENTIMVTNGDMTNFGQIIYIGVFYLLGNGLNILSTQFKVFEKIGFVENVYGTSKEVISISNTLGIEPPKSYELIKNYIDTQGKHNFIRKFEAKYIFYRNMSKAMIISGIILLIKKPYLWFGITTHLEVWLYIILIVICLYNYRNYWKKVVWEIDDALRLIKKQEELTTYKVIHEIKE